VGSLDTAPLHALVATRGARATTIDPMPGGASTRLYFRVALASPESSPATLTTAVAMFVPDGAKAEEIDKGGAPRRWPFLEVGELLAARGVRVPSVLAEDVTRGWLLLEDLGDETLAAALERSPEDRARLYTRAVRDLARAQRSLAELPEDSVVRGRAFDEDLLFWELDHFREWGLDARGKALAPPDRAEFDAVARHLARRIAALPRGFTHRDYQSRNLMVKDGELVWIDFQDALLGPRVYDLVALLNDSYQSFDRAFTEARLDEYAAEAGLIPEERAALGAQFDLVTVQRKLKDAGRFVFIDRVKHNPSFLPFVVPTLRKVAGALRRLEERDEDVARLADLLRRALPEELAR
jgi:aminoglycoside/choline kinase family phosphotransferase